MRDEEDLDIGDMYLCEGFLCYNRLLFFDTNHCIGVSSKTQLCCFKQRFCCRAGGTPMWCEAPREEQTWCQCGLGFCAMGCGVPNQGCFMTRSHVLCLVQNCSIPCNCAKESQTEIKPTLAFMGMACYPKFGCFEKLKDVTDPALEKGQMQSEQQPLTANEVKPGANPTGAPGANVTA